MCVCMFPPYMVPYNLTVYQHSSNGSLPKLKRLSVVTPGKHTCSDFDKRCHRAKLQPTTNTQIISDPQLRRLTLSISINQSQDPCLQLEQIWLADFANYIIHKLIVLITSFKLGKLYFFNQSHFKRFSLCQFTFIIYRKEMWGQRGMAGN